MKIAIFEATAEEKDYFGSKLNKDEVEFFDEALDEQGPYGRGAGQHPRLQRRQPESQLQQQRQQQGHCANANAK